MSTDDPIPQSINVSATLSSLPTEIKTLIVYYSFLQDQSYLERTLSDNTNVSELTQFVLLENRYRGRSLAALFQVDTQFSSLCSVYLFRTLSDVNISSFSFKLMILPRRSHLFRSAIFNHIELNINLEILSTALGLTNLEEVIIHSASFNVIFPSIRSALETVSRSEDFRQGFRNLGQKVTSLVLNDITVKEVITYLPLFPNLTRFVFHERRGNYRGPDRSAQKQKDFVDFGVLLSNYRLEFLHLIIISINGWVHTWTNLDWSSRSSLRSIVVQAVKVGPKLLNFISIFSAQLKLLSLIGECTGLTIPIFTFPSVFSSLEYLSLEMSPTSWITMIRLFSLSPVARLLIHVDGPELPLTISTVEGGICIVVPDLTFLRMLILVDRVIRTYSFPILVNVCAERKISLHFNLLSAHSPDLLNSDNLDIQNQHQLDYQIPILTKALQYGEQKLLRSEKEKDYEGVKDMYERCTWLRANAAEMMD